jgi:hypothetical protein
MQSGRTGRPVAQNPALLTNLVEQANARSKTLIQNQRELRTRNG